MNPISFKANFVHNSIVKSRNPNGRYKDKQVALVKVSDTKADRNSLQDVSLQWTDAAFVESIIVDYFYKTVREDFTVYALTEQENHYRKLQPEKILGLVQIQNLPKKYYVSFLQTKPDCTYPHKKRPFKGIGESLMKSIIALTENKNIYLSSVPDAVDFYKNLGFKFAKKGQSEPLMVLRKSAKKSLK